MDFAQIALFVLACGVGVLGWFARVLYDATQSLRKDLSSLEVRIGTDYIRYDRLQDALKPMMEAIKEIKETLAQRIER
jgi:hypothetical protein